LQTGTGAFSAAVDRSCDASTADDATAAGITALRAISRDVEGIASVLNDLLGKGQLARHLHHATRDLHHAKQRLSSEGFSEGIAGTSEVLRMLGWPGVLSQEDATTGLDRLKNALQRVSNGGAGISMWIDALWRPAVLGFSGGACVDARIISLAGEQELFDEANRARDGVLYSHAVWGQLADASRYEMKPAFSAQETRAKRNV